MLLYLIYNHGLISIPHGPQENGGAYVDDTFFMAIADNFSAKQDARHVTKIENAGRTISGNQSTGMP